MSESSPVNLSQEKMDKVKPYTRQVTLLVRGLIAVLVFGILLNIYSQWQFKGVLDSAMLVKDRLTLYSTSFQNSKPQPNSNGFDTYNNLYGEAAWDEFISKKLRTLASGTSGEFAVLLFQLERQRVLGNFAKTSEAKQQLVEYFELFDNYLKETASCYTNTCYNNAVKTLTGSEGKWGIVMLTVRDAKPFVDLFGLSNKVDKLLS